ncbi:MAG: hypothetical protein QW613_07140, partial [Thermoprotei archaeon]
MNLCTISEIAIGVVATVISESVGERFVLDAGYKSISLDQGVYPGVFDAGGERYDVLSMSEEHTVVKPTDHKKRLGEKFIMLPYHACTTTDLWDRAYVVSRGAKPRSIIIEARGKRE